MPAGHQVQFEGITFFCGTIGDAPEPRRFIHSVPEAKHIPKYEPAAGDPLRQSWLIAYRIICERDAKLETHVSQVEIMLQDIRQIPQGPRPSEARVRALEIAAIFAAAAVLLLIASAAGTSDGISIPAMGTSRGCMVPSAFPAVAARLKRRRDSLG